MKLLMIHARTLFSLLFTLFTNVGCRREDMLRAAVHPKLDGHVQGDIGSQQNKFERYSSSNTNLSRYLGPYTHTHASKRSEQLDL